MCQDTPGVGPVYTPRTPGIASLSEDSLCPAPDIGQDSYSILLEAGLDQIVNGAALETRVQQYLVAVLSDIRCRA